MRNFSILVFLFTPIIKYNTTLPIHMGLTQHPKKRSWGRGLSHEDMSPRGLLVAGAWRAQEHGTD